MIGTPKCRRLLSKPGIVDKKEEDPPTYDLAVHRGDQSTVVEFVAKLRGIIESVNLFPHRYEVCFEFGTRLTSG